MSVPVEPIPARKRMSPLKPNEKKNVRAAIVDYCARAEKARLNRGYSQRRAVIGYGLAPETVQIDDCSGYVSKVCYKAAQVAKVHIVDPLGFHYLGWGNTESMQTYLTHEAPLDKYMVGDIALWGRNDFDTTHTAICEKAGTRKTAVFSSHGHQSWRYANDAPEPLKLVWFPEHLIGVFRLPELR